MLQRPGDDVFRELEILRVKVFQRHAGYQEMKSKEIEGWVKKDQGQEGKGKKKKKANTPLSQANRP